MMVYSASVAAQSNLLVEPAHGVFFELPLNCSPADADWSSCGDLKKRSHAVLTLSNLSARKQVVFKVRTTHPEMFSVKPTQGILYPDQSLQIQLVLLVDHCRDVWRQNPRVLSPHTLSFLIQSFDRTDDAVLTFPTTNLDMFWTKVPRELFSYQKIPVEFDTRRREFSKARHELLPHCQQPMASRDNEREMQVQLANNNHNNNNNSQPLLPIEITRLQQEAIAVRRRQQLHVATQHHHPTPPSPSQNQSQSQTSGDQIIAEQSKALLPENGVQEKQTPRIREVERSPESKPLGTPSRAPTTKPVASPSTLALASAMQSAAHSPASAKPVAVPTPVPENPLPAQIPVKLAAVPAKPKSSPASAKPAAGPATPVAALTSTPAPAPAKPVAASIPAPATPVAALTLAPATPMAAPTLAPAKPMAARTPAPARPVAAPHPALAEQPPTAVSSPIPAMQATATTAKAPSSAQGNTMEAAAAPAEHPIVTITRPVAVPVTTPVPAGPIAVTSPAAAAAAATPLDQPALEQPELLPDSKIAIATVHAIPVTCDEQHDEQPLSVQVKPLEVLQFVALDPATTSNMKEQWSASLILSNPFANSGMLFKVKTTNVLGYLVKPCMGLIEANGHQRIQVVTHLVDQEHAPGTVTGHHHEQVVNRVKRQRKDRFLIQVARLSLAKYNELVELDDKHAKQQVALLWKEVQGAKKVLTCRFEDGPPPEKQDPSSNQLEEDALLIERQTKELLARMSLSGNALMGSTPHMSVVLEKQQQRPRQQQQQESILAQRNPSMDKHSNETVMVIDKPTFFGALPVEEDEEDGSPVYFI